MYTQIVLLLFALHALSAYTVVQIELKNGTDVSEVKDITNNTIKFISPESKLLTLRDIIFVVEEYLAKPEDKDSGKHKTSQDGPTELDSSLRPFTNGHGYQFADWELIDEHLSRSDDKAEDKTDNDSDSDYDADDYDDTDDETDEHDDYREVPVPVIDPRHLDIDEVKKSRNKMFDKMKEKYQSIKRSNVRIDPTEKSRRKRQVNYQNIPGAPYSVDSTALPDYTNKMIMNRAYFDSSKQVISPNLRDENGNNILYDNYNMNGIFADGRQFDNIPRSYGTNLNSDQLYYLNYINNMQNEPIYNQHLSQPVQQIPIESYTVNNNPFRQIKKSPDIELRNVKPILTTDINGMESIQKFNPVQNYEPLNRLPKEIENKNKTQIIDKEKVRNNGEANMTIRQNAEMRNSVNQMNKKIGSIKEKVKDRIANVNVTPEGRKLLTYAMNTAGDRVKSPNDVTIQQVSVNDYILRDSKNLTNDDKLEIKPNSTIVTNNVRDANDMQNNSANNSIIELNVNTDKAVYPEIENSEKNLVTSDTVNQNYTFNETVVENKFNQPKPLTTETLNTIGNETTRIEKDEESLLVQTFVENKFDQPKPPSTETLTGTGNETTKIEKDKESSLLQTFIEKKYDQTEPSTTKTLTATRIETKAIKKGKESSLLQTIVENKYSGQPKPPTNETFTGAGNETGSIEKNKESSLFQANIGTDQPKSSITETFTDNGNKPTNIEKDKDSSLMQTIFENKYDQAEPPITKTFNGTSNETTNIEKDQESSFLSKTIESANETSTTDIKEARSELIDEITEKTESFAANKTDESCNSIEKCHIDDNNEKDKYFENLNLDELFNKDEFWNWLSKWTTAYMEILNENVKTIVKEEVAKQMDEIYSRMRKES